MDGGGVGSACSMYVRDQEENRQGRQGELNEHVDDGVDGVEMVLCLRVFLSELVAQSQKQDDLLSFVSRDLIDKSDTVDVQEGLLLAG